MPRIKMANFYQFSKLQSILFNMIVKSLFWKDWILDIVLDKEIIEQLVFLTEVTWIYLKAST